MGIVQVGIIHLHGELTDCIRVRSPAEAIGIQVIKRDADDPATRDEAGTRQVEQARQQLPSRQVARGAHKHDDLRILRPHPWPSLRQTLPSCAGGPIPMPAIAELDAQ